ncbi:hypothetical protein KZO79_08650 [Chromohalobacter sp. TMW 2.2271]|uniref:hypothetical protein n=1 Tax=Chromohalobacter sp. TMW 2.2271 TaxID=2860330 RepID=UPI001FFD44BF|nr:hypothetical protein [Chromohalobacter sp. TMW 2.2271]MCT8514911.1 hypothetical protein [Chromohalobacter sp. TMW 2.2271]
MARKYESAILLTGDASGAVRAIELTDDHLRQLNARQRRNQQDTSEWSETWDRATGIMKTAAIGAGALTTGLAALAVQQTRSVVQTDNQAKALGIATGQLQAMQYAAGTVGIEHDKMGDILKDVSDKIGDAYANGGGEAIDVINNLGLSAEKLVQMDPAEQIMTIGSSLDQLQSQSERVTALEAISDNAALLLPLLEDNNAEFRRLSQQAYDLNIAIPDDEIQTYRDAYDAVYEMRGAAEGLFNTLISGIAQSDLSGIEDSFESLRDTVTDPQFQESIVTIAQALIQMVDWAAEGMQEFTLLGQQIGTVAANIAGYSDEVADLQGKLQRLQSMRDGSVFSRAGLFDFGTGFDTYMSDSDIDAAIAHIRGRLADLGVETESVTQKNEALSRSAISVATAMSGQSDTTTVVATNLKPLIEDYDQQHQKLEQLREDRAKLQQLIADDPENAEQYRRMLAEVNAQIEKTTESTQRETDAQREHRRALEESAKAYADLFAELSPVGKAQAEYQSTLAQLQLQVEEGTKSELEYYAAVGMASQVYNQAVEDADPYHKQLEEIVDQYDRAHLRGQELAQSLDTLNEAYRRGDVDGATYQRAVAGIRGEMRELALESDPMAQEMARSWEEAADRIDETFADAFTGAFDSFDDFGDQLLDGFKQLLAELAYQATLKPIVVDFTSQARSSLGIPGADSSQAGGSSGGMGGMGDLGSIGKNIYSGITDGFGAINWTGAPTSYSGGFAGSATSGMSAASNGTSYFGGSTSNFGGASGLASIGTSYVGSYVGSEIGSAVSDKQANSNYGQMAGTAIGTYFGGPIGAGIGSAIGSIVDTVFGSGGSDLDIAMMRRQSKEGTNWDHGIVAQGALGAVGFQDDGSHEVADLWDIDEAQKLVDGIAALDTQLASLADTPEQLQQMQDAVLASNRHGIEGHYGETSNPGDVLGRLTSRYKGIIDNLDSEFEPLLMGFDGTSDKLVALATMLDTVETSVGDNAAAMAEVRSQLNASDDIVGTAQDLVAQAQAMGVLSDAAEHLNLTFNSTSRGALEAAGSMAELVGGIDTLSALQSQYYDAFYTDAEKRARLEDDLQERFDDLGLAMPDTTEGFRDLVEAQNLMTEAGREQYAALLNLVPTMSDYISVTEQASDALEQQMSRLQGWIDSLLLSDQSTLDPGERFQEAQSQYASVLVRAEEGDADAIGNLGSVADQFLQEAASYYGQASGQYGDLFEEILADARGIDGSHADGLASVPFDGYRAELHAAETVLPASIAQLYRDSAPGSSTNREMLAELQALRRESQQLREEVRQLRGERSQDAARAAGQRADQLREQQRINRNTKTRPTTV